MISNFVRDNSYFQSLFENNADVTSKDFDTEINNFISFLNKKVVVSINNIAAKSYNGIVGNNNYILKNIGNGKVVFDKLKDINYQNNSITFEKIDFVQPYSLIFVNSKYELMYHAITHDNHDIGGIFGNFDKYLFYQYGQGLKIEGKNFYDKSIKSNNIDANTITNGHISNDGKIFLLKNIKLEARHIINNTIENNKFAYYSITYDKLHPDIRTFRERDDVFLKYEDNSIAWDKVKVNSFDFRLISTNLNKFGYGILHKNVIPLNSVPIAKPDQYAGETINTYQLCIYSIKKAYQLNTYQQPQPDNVYVNPAYTEKLNLYNNVSNQLVAANNYLKQLYQRCIFGGIAILTVDHALGENPKLPNNFWYGEDRTRHIQYARDYQAQLQVYNNLYAYLQNINADLQKIPKNIYTPVPPISYQKLEAVPNTKSYLLHREQQDIKSKHLKDNMFNILNIPDRITYNTVPSEKFISKHRLSPELRAKLGLVL